MTGPQAPPGEEKAGPVGKDRPSTKNIDHDADSLSVPPTDDAVLPTRPWARRADAHEVEIRYRRSVYYWRRRPACDRHGRRAEHECAL
jgi:hypothetical protein